MHDPRPILVAIDAGATTSVAVAVTVDGARIGRAVRGGANPKRHGLEAAADTIGALAREVSGDARPDLVLVAGAGIDRPEHARALETALRGRLPGARVVVVNDTLAVLRAATPDAVGLVVPVSTGGNVIGRGSDGRVTDRGHGIFGGGYVLGALAARAVRAGRVRDGDARTAGTAQDDEASASHISPGGPWIERPLAAEVAAAGIGWRSKRRPAPEAALLGAAVARAAVSGDPYPARMVERWCRRVTGAVREEVDRLGLGEHPGVVVYGGLGDAMPWLAGRIREAVRAGAPGARLVRLEGEPVDGAVALALDAWRGAPIRWDFVPRRR